MSIAYKYALGFLLRKNKEAKSSPRMGIANKYALGFLLRKNKEDLKYGSITHYK